MNCDTVPDVSEHLIQTKDAMEVLDEIIHKDDAPTIERLQSKIHRLQREILSLKDAALSVKKHFKVLGDNTPCDPGCTAKTLFFGLRQKRKDIEMVIYNECGQEITTLLTIDHEDRELRLHYIDDDNHKLGLKHSSAGYPIVAT